MIEVEQKLHDALNQVAVEQIRADEAETARDKEKARADEVSGQARALETKVAELEKARADSEDVDADKLKRQVSVLTQQVGREKARADAAEAPERIRGLVKARVELERQAADVLGAKASFGEMTDRQVKVAVIERLDAAVDGNSSDAYVDGCFKTLVKGHATGSAALERVREAIETRQTETRTDARSARQKFLEAQDNAWKAAR